VKVPNTAFKAVVRDLKYDLCELAIAAFLQAREAGKPYALLPITIMGRGQLNMLFHNPGRQALAPRDLAGKRVGVRSYTTTTGVWVRGLLRDLYGVDPNTVTWITSEDPHVAEYRDPPNVVRTTGKTPEAMLLAGEVDAAILGAAEQPPPLTPLIPDAAAVDAAWAAEHGGVPINHMLVIRTAIARERPDVVRELYRLFFEAKAAAFPSPPVPDPVRFGIEACRGSLDQVIRFCLDQKLITRPVTVDGLFVEARAAGL
jgi:4,5-dihydroxyphthalate decarboxylase